MHLLEDKGDEPMRFTVGVLLEKSVHLSFPIHLLLSDGCRLSSTITEYSSGGLSVVEELPVGTAGFVLQ